MNVSVARKQTLERRASPRPIVQRSTPSEREQAEAEIAGYIAQMTTEMMAMASKARLDLLTYLLSIARTEAEVVARRGFTDHPG
jgi:hypothetical protein